jgi:GNAT superfamily N-acetyltransferase
MSITTRAPSAARNDLPDGTPVLVHPLVRGDEATVMEVFGQLGERSRERRFLTAKPRLTPADLRQLTAVDEHDHVALVARDIDGRAIGIARFVRDEQAAETAEVAVTVVDAWQDRGVGTLLSAALSEAARAVGITSFSMVISHDNEAAVRLLHAVAGDIDRVDVDSHTVEFALSLTPSSYRRSRAVLKGART